MASREGITKSIFFYIFGGFIFSNPIQSWFVGNNYSHCKDFECKLSRFFMI